LFTKVISQLSTTAKLHEAHRKQITLDGQQVSTLVPLYKCKRAGCPNANDYCYELDGVHLKLAPAHFKTWSMSINDTKADLETPPDGLIATLLVSKNGTFNPLRRRGDSKSGIPNVSPESTFSNIATPVPPPHPMYPFSQYPQLPPNYYNPYIPPPPPFQARPPPAPAPIVNPLQFSDSFGEEQDPVEKLIAYIAWISSKSPIQSPALALAKEALLEEGHSFKTIEKLSEANFEKIGIKSGIAMQLKSYIDLYKRKTMNYA